VDSDDLREQIRVLGPWHMDIPLGPDVRTGEGNKTDATGASPYQVSLIDPTELAPLLRGLYPDGMTGKRFLDCACNAAGYSMLASDLGADYCFAFDVRDHWIEQAQFVKRCLGKGDDRVTAEVCDLLQIDERLGDERFDVTLFKGILYHLPDPVAGLKLVADRTDEVLIVDSAAVSGVDDGYLKLFWEGVENPMSGVHHLAWRPTGPGVIVSILEWLGFPAHRVVFWRHNPERGPDLARVRVVGARDPARLAGLDRPPESAVLVPESGAVVSGTIPLNAGVTDALVDTSAIEFRVSGEGLDDSMVGDATPTFSGWICMWDTTTVPNGTYVVTSVARDLAGNVGRGRGVEVTVRNRPSLRLSRRRVASR
jgi:hypothetical protein